jgi:hypothetical protein
MANPSYNLSSDQGGSCSPSTEEKKVRQQIRHIEDPITSVVALLVWAALGFLGMLVLALLLALGI